MGSKKSYDIKSTVAGYLFISPWLIGFLCFMIIPIFVSLYISFTKYDLISSPVWVGLKNFQRLFLIDPRYRKSLSITFLYVVTAVPLRLVFALFIAMILC